MLLVHLETSQMPHQLIHNAQCEIHEQWEPTSDEKHCLHPVTLWRVERQQTDQNRMRDTYQHITSHSHIFCFCRSLSLSLSPCLCLQCFLLSSSFFHSPVSATSFLIALTCLSRVRRVARPIADETMRKRTATTRRQRPKMMLATAKAREQQQEKKKGSGRVQVENESE